MAARASPLSWGSRNASSGSSGRVSESIRNGEPHVEIDLLSDDDEDNALPSQRASSSASQCSDKAQRMLFTGMSFGKQTAPSLAEASTYKSPLRRAQPTGVERRLYTTAPRASFPGVQMPPQVRQSRSRTSRVQGGQASQVQGSQASQVQGSHIQDGHAQGIQLKGVLPQSARVQGKVKRLEAGGARIANVKAQPGHTRSDETVPQAQQNPTKGNSTFISGKGKDTVREKSTGMFADQAQDIPSQAARRQPSGVGLTDTTDGVMPLAQHHRPGPALAAAMEPPFRSMSPMAQQLDQRSKTDPGAQRGLPVYSQAQPVVRSNINALSQPQRVHGMTTGRPFFTNPSHPHGVSMTSGGGPSTPLRPTFDELFRPRAAANTSGTPPRAAAGNTTSQVMPSSTARPSIRAPPRIQQELKKDDIITGTKRSAMSREDGLRKPALNINKPDSDNKNVLTNFPSFKKQKQDDDPYEYTEDFSDGNEEYSPTRRQVEQRARARGYKRPKTEPVSNTPSRIVTLLNPSVPMGKDYFTPLPDEIRQRIYRELLKANDCIKVLNGWSQVYRRQQLELHTSILGVNKKHNADANAVLYGENVFRYLLRDEANMVEFEVGKQKKDERTLPLRKQIDNFRYLELEVEPNRIDMEASLAFYAALEILDKIKATKLIRLTIDLSPRLQKGVQGQKGAKDVKDWISQRVWFTKSQGVTNMLKKLKAHFVYFDIHLEENNHSKATNLRTVVDLRPDIGDNKVSAELSTHSEYLKRTMSIEARRALARERIDERLEAEAYKKLDMMSTRLEQAVLKGAPHMVHRGWFKEFQPGRQQRKTILAGDYAVEDE